MKKILRVTLALLMATCLLFAFTACSDDDDDDSREFTEEDEEIVGAIMDAVTEAIEDEKYTASVSGLTVTFTLQSCSYTETSYTDSSDVTVTLQSGSTIKYKFDSSAATSGTITYDIDAVVDGTSYDFYLKCYYSASGGITISKVELDGVTLTGGEEFLTSSARSIAG